MKHARRWRVLIPCLALAAALLVPLCARSTFLYPEDGGQANAWTYPVPLAVLDDPMDVLRLINRENLLDRGYPDQSVEMYRMVRVTAPVTEGGMTIRAIVNSALVEMLEAAKDEGIRLYVGSAYRDYRAQEVSHYNRVKRMGRDDQIVQPAGASEHQAGLAADVVSWAYRDGFKTSFGQTKEGIWLAENCARFGFIIRYPEGATDITGVRYEPWHVRYVGVEAALYITGAALTLEAFTDEWQAALHAYEGAE